MTEKELMAIKRDLQRRAKKKGFGKKRTGAYVFGTLRRVRGNPVNEALVILPWKQIVKEYDKGGEGKGAKLMFTSKPLLPAQAYMLINEIGDYNDFDAKKVSRFVSDIGNMNQFARFRVGREYSPCIYIENVAPKEADKIIQFSYETLKADEAHYMPIVNRVRLWWD